MSEFQAFPKIARLSREVIVTEKIDGTNAQIFVNDDMTDFLVGTRTAWITPANDHFGFARWALAHKEELLRLGPGSHFGEWWGSGIQRRYGLHEKRFSLFNVHRWGNDATRPTCCHVVPELWRGNFDDLNPKAFLEELAKNGSRAAPGFMKPEGIVIYHVAAAVLFKKTIEKDAEPKSASAQP